MANPSEMVDSVNVRIFADNKVTMEGMNNWKFLWSQHTTRCMIIFPFLKSLIIGFH